MIGRRGLAFRVLALPVLGQICLPERVSDEDITPQILRLVHSKLTTYCDTFGEYPPSLNEERLDAVWLDDHWGQRLVYRRLPSGFVLFSEGRDGVANTADDVWPSMHWKGCSFVWSGTAWIEMHRSEPIDPVDRVSMALVRRCNHLWAFKSQHGRCPHSLTELAVVSGFETACLGSDATVTDPWGEEFVLERIGQNCEIYSKGPDRLPGSDDDVWAGDVSDQCRDVDSGKDRGCGCSGFACRELVASGQTAIRRGQSGPATVRDRAKVRIRPGACGCSFVGRGRTESAP